MDDVRQKTEDLKKALSDITKVFEVTSQKAKLASLESEASEVDFWANQEKARAIMQEIADIKSELDEIVSLESDLATLSDLTQNNVGGFERELAALEKRVAKLKLKSFLAGKYDSKNAIIGIHAGQGGTEAMDWASMLYRMYTRYCERRNWKTEVIDESTGEEAGFKSITFKVEGANSYGLLKYESGTHRLVRQSPFNADRLRQTSFALVEILPELEEVDSPDITIKDPDLEWQFFRSSSQGGQNVQKVSTAVRLKHMPSGIVVTAQTERFQEQNRKIALNLLRAKLWIVEEELAKKTVKQIKGDYRPASWGTQIRSYVLHPYKMIKDLRTDYEVANTESVLDGDLDNFIEAELVHFSNKQTN